MELWKTWYELNVLIRDKGNIYLYGRSEDWVHKCLERLEVEPEGIIDREETYHGTTYCNLPIQPIEAIDLNYDTFFIITAGEFDGIIDTLENYGMKPGKNFVCSPDFHDYRRVIDFHSQNYSILLSSSDYNDQKRARASRMGGGLYELNTSTGELIKMVSGSFRQIDFHNNFIVGIDYVDRGLNFFDESYRLVKKISLPKANYCGLAIDKESDVAYLANAGDDSILEIAGVSETKPVMRHLNILDKNKGSNRQSHVNDLFFLEQKLLFSYFSRSGNYKINTFDGGVSHYDFIDGKLSSELISTLWKPHSPKVIDGKLWVLDSMRGRLVSGFGDEFYDIGGFVRGLDQKDEVMAIGQSQDMYLSDRISQNKAVSVDSGIHLFNVESKALRFIPTNSIMNIHDLKILKNV